jgi:hypothetical protein
MFCTVVSKQVYSESWLRVELVDINLIGSTLDLPWKCFSNRQCRFSRVKEVDSTCTVKVGKKPTVRDARTSITPVEQAPHIPYILHRIWHLLVELTQSERAIWEV